MLESHQLQLSKCFQTVLRQAASFLHFHLPFLHDHICISCTTYAFITANVLTVPLQLMKCVNMTALFSEIFSHSLSSIFLSFRVLLELVTSTQLTLLLSVEHFYLQFFCTTGFLFGQHTANNALDFKVAACWHNWQAGRKS